MDVFEFPEEISRYAAEHSSEEDAVLKELFRQTHLKTVHPQMLSGKVQGLFLSFISQLKTPKKILEIGTFTGYSAYCLSKGLLEGGLLTTIEVNEELEEMILDFLDKAGIRDKVKLLIGDARVLIPQLDRDFELIFIDANKEHYPQYYQVCMEALSPGGIIIADNVLWGGKVVHEPRLDESTRKLHEFNTLVKEDPRVENVFLTVRDGLMLIKKK